ncbi:general secretion pathway protein [Pusillimonas sp. TS35]|uniref:general secretion pathway protein n=1 Tax=Paracandidimonas lactea TaxID=2895524 RepID=UPI00136C4062|nr:general secretion pathway protein [Paracandidimonas lactea]MYN11919.1 general secretion pathway protein [Pusillimonas sp. TS35]
MQGIRLWRDNRHMRAKRGDYCDYLGALLSGQRGARTLRAIFAQDAARHGATTVRGRLSAHWMRAYEASGGDLYITWQGSFPQDERAALRVLQAAGSDALIDAFKALSADCDLMRRIRDIYVGSLCSAGVAMMLLTAMLLAVAWWTTPRLLHAFSALPPAYYGELTHALTRLAEWVRAGWLAALVTATGAWAFMIWSLPNLVCGVRVRLDRLGPWRLYRQYQSLRLFGLLSILLGQGEGGPTRLRTALQALGTGATPWLSSQIERMLARIEAGHTGAASFDTGLLAQEHYWFLADLITARGLGAGLPLGAGRLREQLLSAAGRHALRLRWGLLLGVLFCMLGLGVWHYAVIDELRRALLLLYADQ